jgi:hypothetical protein
MHNIQTERLFQKVQKLLQTVWELRDFKRRRGQCPSAVIRHDICETIAELILACEEHTLAQGDLIKAVGRFANVRINTCKRVELDQDVLVAVLKASYFDNKARIAHERSSQKKCKNFPCNFF